MPIRCRSASRSCPCETRSTRRAMIRPTRQRFFDELGEERSRLLTHVSADGADWIAEVVAERASQAILCLDPFHVVRWATDALDEIRREVWNQARRRGDK